MRNIKLTLAYDGTDFHGWQIQPLADTVQGTLASAIGRVTGEKVLPQGSGRTDAGVHALAQVASFATEANVPAANFCKALNDLLPGSVRVMNAEEVPPEFHARHSARAKTYQYRICRERVCSPFDLRYAWHYPFPLDETAVFGSAQAVIGEHDFSSFAASDPEKYCDEARSNVRTIYSSAWEKRGSELVYTVRGNGFLHHMVRNLVGTFIEAGRGLVSAKEIASIIAAKDRSHAGATAPACGLMLMGVEY